jgi:hypothetical protein
MKKPSTNDITGDKLQSKVPSDAYRDNYDRIFGKKEPSRIDVIGQNGNEGDHYDGSDAGC